MFKRSFQLPLKIETREDDGNYVKLSGHALQWDKRSEVFPGALEYFTRGAFPSSTREDTRFLIKHGGLPLARVSSKTLTIREDDTGLLVEPILDLRDPDSKGLMVKVDRGDVDGLSVGFIMKDGKQTFDYSKEGTVTREISRVGKLLEVSAVTFPVHDSTLDISVRMKQEYPEEAIEHLTKEFNSEKMLEERQKAGELDLLKLQFQLTK